MVKKHGYKLEIWMQHNKNTFVKIYNFYCNGSSPLLPDIVFFGFSLSSYAYAKEMFPYPYKECFVLLPTDVGSHIYTWSKFKVNKFMHLHAHKMSLIYFTLKFYSKLSVWYMSNKCWTYIDFVQLVSNINTCSISVGVSKMDTLVVTIQAHC